VDPWGPPGYRGAWGVDVDTCEMGSLSDKSVSRKAVYEYARTGTGCTFTTEESLFRYLFTTAQPAAA